MARGSRRLTLAYSSRALLELEAIWEWNAKTYGFSHANRYAAYLTSATAKLCGSPNPGRAVPKSAIYRYAILRRRHKGYGHLVVFTIEATSLRIWHYYHTSQNWQTELAKESPP